MFTQPVIYTALLLTLAVGTSAFAGKVRTQLCAQRVIAAGPYNWGNLHEFVEGEIFEPEWAATMFEGEDLAPGPVARSKRIGALSLLLKSDGVEVKHKGHPLSYFNFTGAAFDNPHFKTFELSLGNGRRLVFEFRFAERRSLQLFLEEGDGDLSARTLILKARSAVEISQ